MKKLLEEYRRSLKMREAEEMFDLLFYRPIAFFFVKGIYRLPVTPNQVTMLSMASSIIAGWEFATGTTSAITAAAIWYAVANILDCSDGQLARLQNSGTPLGRIIDGTADYVSTIAIFLGIGVGLSDGVQWILVVAAGASSALHAIIFDHYQGAFISTVRNAKNSLQEEQKKFTAQLDLLKERNESGAQQVLIRMYLVYLALQTHLRSRTVTIHYSPEDYRSANRLMIRLWSFLGPTTNRTLLIVCALFMHVDLFLWVVCIPANIWLLACYSIQKRVDKQLSNVGRSR